ncbi:MAG TPA: response regulator, partial [Candidatus Binatia bacterium]|nr:response regulator [Candidatus Binatia bacterium]
MSKGRILVVDDDLMMHDALRDTLAGEGYHVHTVENAIQAMAELERQEFDVVAADLSLPRVSGLELLDSVKRSWPTVEVIVVTGQGSIATAVDAIKRGAYHY